MRAFNEGIFLAVAARRVARRPRNIKGRHGRIGIFSAAPFRKNVMFIRFVLRGLMALGLVGVSALPAIAADGLDNGDTAWILSAPRLSC